MPLSWQTKSVNPECDLTIDIIYVDASWRAGIAAILGGSPHSRLAPDSSESTESEQL